MRMLGTVLLIVALHISAVAGSINPIHETDKSHRNASGSAERDAKTEARIEVLQNRLKEIEQMDFGKLERSEKKEVKSELREIRRELKAYNASGIYISIGGLLIIVLLLILLL